MVSYGMLWFIFGTILGSFGNVLVVRNGTARGRSRCPHCDRELSWYELVPIISWLALRGRCRTCRASISVQYPAVEILMGGAVFAVGSLHLTPIESALSVALVFLMVIIAVYDFVHLLIPDRWAYTFILIAALLGILIRGADAWFFLSGPLVALPLLGLWFFSRGKWMGFGDVYLALGMGFLLGGLDGYLALCLAFILGALIGVCVLLPLPFYRRLFERLAPFTPTSPSPPFPNQYTMKSEVPFGPFLLASVCIVWFLSQSGVDLWSVLFL